MIKVKKVDSDAEGKMDSMNVYIEFRGNPKDIRNVQVIGTFDYYLKKRLLIEMIGMMHISIDTPDGASTIFTDGELKLKQSAPVTIDSLKRTLYDINPLDDYNSHTMLEILELY